MDTIAKAGVVVAYGALLGIGFWAGKKITNAIDEKLALSNDNLINKLKSQYSDLVNKKPTQEVIQ
jgi:uncharacterized protein YdgA (DUF945 family)